jgi:hypothetical protein
MMTDTQKYNVAVVVAALSLLDTPGMTIDRLRELREDQVRLGFDSKADEGYYDAILTAIEMMERPLFE